MRIRMQRGGLNESLQTMEEINTHEELRDYLARFGFECADALAMHQQKQNGSLANPLSTKIDSIITVKYYAETDIRCGWDETWLISVRPKGSNNHVPIAFADGDVTALH